MDGAEFSISNRTKKRRLREGLDYVLLPRNRQVRSTRASRSSSSRRSTNSSNSNSSRSNTNIDNRSNGTISSNRRLNTITSSSKKNSNSSSSNNSSIYNASISNSNSSISNGIADGGGPSGIRNVGTNNNRSRSSISISSSSNNSSSSNDSIGESSSITDGNNRSRIRNFGTSNNSDTSRSSICTTSSSRSESESSSSSSSSRLSYSSDNSGEGEDFDEDLFDFAYLNRPVNEGNESTLGEAFFMLQTFTVRFALSARGMESLLDICNCLLGPTSILPASKHLLDTIYKKVLHLHMNYFFYCSECSCFLKKCKKEEMKKEEVICRICSTRNVISTKSGNFFIMFDIANKLKTFLRDVSEELTANENVRFAANETLKDIYDGEMYKNLKIDDGILSNRDNFSLNFNVDGASVFEDSKRSCWPIQFFINELPPRIRFRNIVVAGLWFGKNCIDQNLFLKPFVDAIEEINTHGLRWTDHMNQQRSSKFQLLCSCLDSQARPKVMNMTTFNGEFGCPYCYDPGLFIDNAWRFPYFLMDEGLRRVREFPERTSQAVKLHMETAVTSGEPEFGFKGLSALYACKNYDMVWGFPPDKLHFETGVLGRTLFKDSWLTLMKDIPAPPYYIGTKPKMEIVNNRLKSIKPPNEIHRLTRPMEKSKKWKGHEYNAFLLYYGIPVLSGVLPDRYLQHFALLVESMTLVSGCNISQQDIEKSKRFFQRFNEGVCTLYGIRRAVFNVHITNHYGTAVKVIGPSWTFTTNPFESNMKNLGYCVKGSNGVMQQIATKIAIKDSLSELSRGLQVNEEVQAVLERMSPLKPRSASSFRVQGAVIFGRGETLDDRDLAALNAHEVDLQQPAKFKKMISSGTVYTTTSYREDCKRDNSSMQFHSGEFGRLRSIVVTGQNCYLVVERLLTHPFVANGESMSNLFRVDVRLNNRTIIKKPEDIAVKCIISRISAEKMYISKILTNFEVQ